MHLNLSLVIFVKGLVISQWKHGSRSFNLESFVLIMTL